MTNTVIVIGAGLAGMVAAVTAREKGARVLLMDRGGIGTGTNSAMSNGRFAGPTASYSADEHVRDTIRIGKKINHRPRVEQFVREASEAFDFFRRAGFELEEGYDHYFLCSSRPDMIRGVSMVKRLAEQLKQKQIQTLSGFYITDILQREGSVHGVRGLIRNGKETFVASSAVILATGGGGAVYLRNDNQKRMLGQGYYLAAKAGIPLWDMEFVQFYPIVLAQPRLPAMMIYPPYPSEARLINGSGQDILKKYGIDDINDAMRKKRDSLSALLFDEGCGGAIYMDFRNVPAAAWETSTLRLLSRMRFDFKHDPVAISPGAHFLMGGIRTDDSGQTDLPGLYACGEAVWGFHGANRLSGNALTECLVSGRIAGRYAADNSSRSISDKALRELSLKRSVVPGPVLSFKEGLHKVRDIAWKHAGIVRTGPGLNAGLNRLKSLEMKLECGAPKSGAEIKQKEDLLSAVFLLKGILTASIARKESRGAFIREEFSIRGDDEDRMGRKNSRLTFDPETGEFSSSHHPV
jgi:succinate dehydrogenase/fumarate reductase flavoprotein subunit